MKIISCALGTTLLISSIYLTIVKKDSDVFKLLFLCKISIDFIKKSNSINSTFSIVSFCL